MPKTSSATLATATVLAFERKLDPSDALFFAGRWDDRNNSTSWRAIGIREKSVRGTISNRDPAKFAASIKNPNLQTVDVAALPGDADTLKVRFTIRILGGCGKPSACNNADYQDRLLANVKSYVDKNGFRELADRYAINIANGRFLWRNRLSAEAIEVSVSHRRGGETIQSWLFDSLSVSTQHFNDKSDHLQGLGRTIESGLAGDPRAGNGYVLLEVTAFVRMGDGQEVFPSQELILEKDSKKSKTLYQVDQIAGMHSQKLGNALRTIDTWYPLADQTAGPIAVEPYGSVTALGKAFRQPKENQDFYSLLDAWMLKDQLPPLEQQHFVIATLIRGGVFGDSGKE